MIKQHVITEKISEEIEYSIYETGTVIEVWAKVGAAIFQVPLNEIQNLYKMLIDIQIKVSDLEEEDDE